jgi:hypothetical protein
LFFRGVARFLEQALEPATQVSFNGTPFTSHPKMLAEMLVPMRRYPNGRSAPGKDDWVPAMIRSQERSSVTVGP